MVVGVRACVIVCARASVRARVCVYSVCVWLALGLARWPLTLVGLPPCRPVWSAFRLLGPILQSARAVAYSPTCLWRLSGLQSLRASLARSWHDRELIASVWLPRRLAWRFAISEWPAFLPRALAAVRLALLRLLPFRQLSQRLSRASASTLAASLPRLEGTRWKSRPVDGFVSLSSRTAARQGNRRPKPRGNPPPSQPRQDSADRAHGVTGFGPHALARADAGVGDGTGVEFQRGINERWRSCGASRE